MALQKETEIEAIFIHYDTDHSGTLEIGEMQEMFSLHKIPLTREQLTRVFALVDEKGSGSLTLDEFKAFFSDQIGNSVFKNIMNSVKLQHPELGHI
jgi:Ca2+-binding EF-hand superfamily protein